MRPHHGGGSGGAPRPSSGQRCYNCGEFGHISYNCGRPQVQKACYNCNQGGHVSRECPYERKPRVCYRCQQPGHIAVDCPAAAAMAYAAQQQQQHHHHQQQQHHLLHHQQPHHHHQLHPQYMHDPRFHMPVGMPIPPAHMLSPPLFGMYQYRGKTMSPSASNGGGIHDDIDGTKQSSSASYSQHGLDVGSQQHQSSQPSAHHW